MKLLQITLFFISLSLIIFFSSGFKSLEYETRNIQGWNIKINRQLLTQEGELTQKALASLNTKLQDVNRVIPQQHHKFLHNVTIWVEKATPGFKGMVYHPSAEWLQKNGYNPAKAKAIEIANVSNFISWTETQPWHLLHELAHAYHDRVIGKDFAPIVRAYNNAVNSGLYRQVARNRGDKLWEAYALKNRSEYFAELSEAYFGENDFYPFNRRELAAYDRQGYRAIEQAWIKSSYR